jgi:hypothetical protein
MTTMAPTLLLPAVPTPPDSDMLKMFFKFFKETAPEIN